MLKKYTKDMHKKPKAAAYAQALIQKNTIGGGWPRSSVHVIVIITYIIRKMVQD